MTETTTDLTRGIYRRIYSSVRTDRQLNAVSPEAALLYFHITTTVDDFGNMHGDPELVRVDACPIRRGWDDAHVSDLLAELAGTDPPLVQLYEHQGNRYLHVRNFLLLQPCPRNGRRIQRSPASPYDDAELSISTAKPGESRGVRMRPGDSGGNRGRPDASWGFQGSPGESGGNQCPR